MAQQYIPQSVPSDGTVALWWVPVIADPAAPKVSELTGVDVVALQCYLKENFSPDASSEDVEDRRMCSKQVFQRGGMVTYTIDDLIGIMDPQGKLGDSNKAYEALAPGSIGYLVARWGIDLEGAEAEPAAGQTVDVYHVEIGHRSKLPQEANSQLKFKAKPRVISTFNEDVVLAA
ncbi:MAG TPA: hypothetical protein VFL73_01930 [Solirubrobacteraceae bacterium]|nr:hypothetical protein [Solirubrobacteraceae bacterium]